MVANTCNPSTGEAEAGGSQVQGQPGLHSKTLSQQNKTNKKKKLKVPISKESRGLGLQYRNL
jgi:hypothetical protein